jgi:fumarate reductase subunit D
MHRIYKSEVAEGTFSNGKNITAFLLSVLLIMIGNFLYFKALNPDSSSLSMLWAAVWQTLVIAVLIVGVYMTFDNARLRREIERVQQINQRLTANTSAQTVETQNFASLPSDKTTINPDTLLYIESDKNYCKITTADGAIALKEVQIAGKKRMDIKSFLLGFREPEAYSVTPGTSKAEIAKTKAS